MANKGKTVVIAALDGTFQRKAFASILELIPLSEHVVKLNAVCMTCFGDGSFTKRISADKEVLTYYIYCEYCVEVYCHSGFRILSLESLHKRCVNPILHDPPRKEKCSSLAPLRAVFIRLIEICKVSN